MKNFLSFLKKRSIITPIEFVAIIIIICLGFAFYHQREEKKLNEYIKLVTPAAENTQSSKKLHEYWNLRNVIHLLASKKVSLSNIDLSCENVGGEWIDELYLCKNFMIYLDRLDLSKKKHGHQVMLKNSRFDGAKMHLNIYSGAKLIDIYFNATELRRSKFDQAELNNVIFKKANIFKNDFSGSILIDVEFTGANMQMTDFTAAKAEKVKFDVADLYATKFIGTDLGGAIFDWANLSNADYKDANLNGASFYGAEVWEVDFSEAKNLSKEQLENVWVWGDAKDENLPKIPQNWQVNSRSLILFCDPSEGIREEYYFDQKIFMNETGALNYEKCKKWNEWSDEKKNSWQND